MAVSSTPRRSEWRFAAALAAALAVLYLAVSWPLALHWPDAQPDYSGKRGTIKETIPEGDNAIFLWNLWWTSQAIYERHSTPFFTPMQNAPFGLSLAYAPICPLYGLLDGPFRAWATPAAQRNFWMAASMILTCLGVALLVLELGGGRPGAALAAFILFFDSFHRSHAPAHLNILSTGWPVLTLWLIVRLRRRKEWRSAAGAALGAAATFYTSFYHTVFLAFVVALYYLAEIMLAGRPLSLRQRRWLPWGAAGVLAIWFFGFQFRALSFSILMAGAVACLLIWRSREPVMEGRIRAHAARQVLFAGLALALCAPLLWATVGAERPANWAETSNLYSATFFSNTPMTLFLTPRAAEWLNARLGRADELFRFRADDEFAFWLGFAAWLAVIAPLLILRRGARWKRWLFVGGGMYVLSWGAHLLLPGAIYVSWLPENVILLPGYAAKLLPPLQDFRVFSRAAFYTNVALAVFAGVNLAPTVQAVVRSRGGWAPALVAAALAIGLLAERARPPVGLTLLERPPEYAALAEAPEDSIFLFVPPAARTQALYCQTLHGKRVANFHTYRVFESLLAEMANSPAWNFFDRNEYDGLPLFTLHDYAVIRRDLEARGVDCVAVMTRYLSPDSIVTLDHVLRERLGMTRVHAGMELFLYALDPQFRAMDESAQPS